MSTMDHVRWLSKPSLKRPVIVTAFTGWNDAADAASNAVRNLIEGWKAQPLAEIDPEEYKRRITEFLSNHAPSRQALIAEETFQRLAHQDNTNGLLIQASNS